MKQLQLCKWLLVSWAELGVVTLVPCRLNPKSKSEAIIFMCFYAKGLMTYPGENNPSEQVGQTSAERMWLNGSI